MMIETIVHPRVMKRHPDLTEQDVLSAWENMLAYLPRLGDDPDQYIAVGSDSNGRLIEMVAKRVSNNIWVVFHAMTPPSRKTLIELKLTKR